MQLKIYQADAFASTVFTGNPAAVCPLEEWIDDSLMQKIAMENNLSETAFYVKKNDQIEIRWMTPTTEVDLCGHATLAAAYVLFHFENYNENIIRFYSPRSGVLIVKKEGESISMNFPSDKPVQSAITDNILKCFNIPPVSVLKGKTDLLLIYEKEEDIINLIPDLSSIEKIKVRGIIVTAPGNQSDFVSRFFAPQSGVNEDPVTGSAHTTLTPYWSEILNKEELTAIQLSSRKGYLICKNLNDRIEISGTAKLYLKGEIFIDEI